MYIYQSVNKKYVLILKTKFVTYSYVCRNIVNTIMTNETQFFRKIYLSHLVRKGYVWEMSWRLNKAATYWPPALLAIAALLSHPVGLLNQGPWGPSSLLGLVFTCSNCYHWLHTLISNKLELPVAPGYITASAHLLQWASHLHSIQPVHSQGYPLISSTGYTCYLHRCISYLKTRAGRRTICYKLFEIAVLICI